MTQPSLRNNSAGNTLKLCSWNCKGLNQPVKRGKVLQHLQHLGAGIAFLQETHLKISDHSKLRKGWVGQLFHSTFQTKSRGTAILIHKSVPFISSSVSLDPNGRYVVVTGSIYNTKLILANVYAPNWDDSNFFHNFFSKLPDMSSHFLILGGDLNCWLSPLDRSSRVPTTLSKSSKTIHTFLEEFSVVDSWRFFNPTGREYSFFSPVHHTYTRIDYFFLDKRLIPSVRSCSYNAIVISDHGPLTLDLVLGSGSGARAPWRFNSRLLSDSEFVSFLNTHIDLFRAKNETPGISPSLLWETFKAYIRGQIISYTGFERKQRKRRLSELMTRILQLDSIYATSPSPTLYKERIALQAEFDNLSTVQVEDLLFRSRHAQYEYGEKASKLLAHQLRQTSSTQQITQIQTPTGITTDPRLINDQFLSFYRSLYTSEQSEDPSMYDSFFSTFDIPSMEETSRLELEEHITIEEIECAVGAMQSCKCPGPDGLPVEFYRKFKEKIVPLLIGMFNHSMDESSLPQSLSQASISLLLKKGKDPLSCGSYRPISLLNVDYKILAKLLAMRLEKKLPPLISPDQTGFIRNRHAFSNVRRLFNIMYNPSNSEDPEFVISIDAEKAFDRVEWGYLFRTLERFGFGERFIAWIRLLYSSPLASVRTNNDHSAYFPLFRGTRQGCPLSPLLFAVAIEPLAIALRSNPHIEGVTRNGIEQRVSLYADDLLLYVSRPDMSIPTVLSVLNTFGHISGYKLNLDKSELFPLNTPARNFALDTLPFKSVKEKFTYLGVKVTGKFGKLFEFNFSPLVARMRQDFGRWSLLPLSLAGRINSVKMNILPKFSFLFQSIPIFIPKTFFQKLDRMISDFIWNKKTPRIRKMSLQRARNDGGMALPNFLFHYWAANFRTLQYWLRADQDLLLEVPSWLGMEMASCVPSSLSALIHTPSGPNCTGYCKNILVKSTLKIWTQFRRHFKWKACLLHGPIYRNHAFRPSISDGAFSIWHNLGLKTFKDLYIEGSFASFQQISDKFGVPNTHFFRYLQLRSFVKDMSPQFPLQPETSPIHTFLSFPTMSLKGIISCGYGRILCLHTPPLLALKASWEEDLGEEIDDDLWDDILHRVHSSSVCAAQGLIQCKILHRTHWTKLRLSKIYPEVDPLCDRCRQSPASLTHMLWSCPSLHNYWSNIFETLSKALKVPIEPAPLIAIFGVTPRTMVLPKIKSDLVAFLTLLARRLILRLWKSRSPPTYEAWIRDALFFSKLDKIKYTLRGSTEKFYKAWDPLLNHIETLHFRVIPQ